MMLVIRTKHDIQTTYLYAYTEPLIKEAEDRGIRVEKVEGDDVNFKNIDKRIKAKQFKLILFNGHGSKTSLYNNHGEEFINLSSAHLFSRTVTFARACDSLIILGVEAVKKGCYSFIGYKKKFWIARQNTYECNPEKDAVAKGIIECSNVVIKELLKGKTVAEAVDKSHQHSEKTVMEMIYSKEPLASPALSALIANDSALDYEGDSNARIR